MEVNTIIGLLGAFDLGSVATSIVNYWFSAKKEKDERKFQEKKEAYIGFLDAMNKSEIERTDEAAINVGHWNNRLELVGSHEAIKLCNKIRETNPVNGKVHPERPKIFHDLKDAMRKDLGIDV